MNGTEMPFKVEAWTKSAEVDRLLATASDILIGRAVSSHGR
jgi:hypothetical protein